MSHEIFEQAVFLDRKLDVYISSFSLPGVAIQYQIITSQLVGGNFLAAAQQCLDACFQFLETEWLDKVIIRSRVQSLDNILSCAQSRQHDNGSLVTEHLAIEMAKFQTVYFRHDNIQY